MMQQFCIVIIIPSQPGRQRILGNILERIGDTPLVRLNRIPQSEGVECDVCTVSTV
jgi:hypothetical protein